MLGVPIKFVAAEAGFFPPGPLTLLADIVIIIRDTGEEKEVTKERTKTKIFRI